MLSASAKRFRAWVSVKILWHTVLLPHIAVAGRCYRAQPLIPAFSQRQHHHPHHHQSATAQRTLIKNVVRVSLPQGCKRKIDTRPTHIKKARWHVLSCCVYQHRPKETKQHQPKRWEKRRYPKDGMESNTRQKERGNSNTIQRRKKPSSTAPNSL